MIISSQSALNRFYSRLAVGLVLLFFGTTQILAQTPLGISYQAIARNPDGLPLAEEPVEVKFRIHNGSASGPVEYAEHHNAETNKFGLFTLEIGKGDVISGTFESISWDTGKKFLEVEINNTLSSTSELLSVPYALYAAGAKEKQTLNISGNKLSITDGNEVTLPGGPGGATSVSDLNDVDISGLQSGQVLKWNGTEWVPGDDNTLNGQAAGDVTGTYNALKVQGIQNQPVDPSIPTTGQVFQWDGTKWKPSLLPGSSGLLDDLTDVNAPAPSNGQFLQWNASSGAWQPTTATGGTSYTAGTGISIDGSNQISNIGDLSNTNEIQSLSFNQGNNTLSLSQGGGSVIIPQAGNIALDALTDVNAPAPSTGQVLQWDGTEWKPVTLTSGTALTAGSGIQINGNIISANDNSATNEIQTLSLANGNELTLSNGGGSVVLTTANYAAGSGIQINGSTISANDNSTTNEIQNISLTGNIVSLSNGGGSFSLPDTSSNNEIQTLSYNSSNNQLSISGAGGNTVTLPISPVYVQDIAIFEERKPLGEVPFTTGNWTKRLLNYTVSASPNNSVQLNGSNIKFNQPGKYLITASAPAQRTGQHRLVLQRDDGSDIIDIFGTSELSVYSVSAENRSITRSFVVGVLTIGGTLGTDISVQYKLNHYAAVTVTTNEYLGYATGLPAPNNTPNDYETYSQIMIQKIQ